jgi:hypothetical protein
MSGTTLGVPLNNWGNPLKTYNKPKPNAPRLNTQGMAHATVALAAHQRGPLKDPLEQAHASLGWAPPRSRGCAYLEQAPPRSRALRTRTPIPVRGYGHLMLWQRRAAPSCAWDSRPGPVAPTP